MSETRVKGQIQVPPAFELFKSSLLGKDLLWCANQKKSRRIFAFPQKGEKQKYQSVSVLQQTDISAAHSEW